MNTAKQKWFAAQPLEAGLILEAGVTAEAAVRWAARLALLIDPGFPVELAESVSVTLVDEEKWLDANTVFSLVREHSIANPHVIAQPAEHALKLAFNIAGGDTRIR